MFPCYSIDSLTNDIPCMTLGSFHAERGTLAKQPRNLLKKMVEGGSNGRRMLNVGRYDFCPLFSGVGEPLGLRWRGRNRVVNAADGQFAFLLFFLVLFVLLLF